MQSADPYDGEIGRRRIAQGLYSNRPLRVESSQSPPGIAGASIRSAALSQRNWGVDRPRARGQYPRQPPPAESDEMTDAPDHAIRRRREAFNRALAGADLKA